MNPSTSTTSPSSGGGGGTVLSTYQKTAIVAGGVVAAASIGLAAYYIYKKYGVEEVDPLQMVEDKKAQGNEFFRVKNFDGALMAFDEAIKSLAKLNDHINKTKVNELISTCHNNMAACYEQLGKHGDCVKHCSEAININPNYYKAINRRARSNCKLDYVDVLAISTNHEQVRTLNLEVDRIGQLYIKPELDSISAELEDKYKGIPQNLIGYWLWNSVTNDPIIEDLNCLNENDINDVYSAALLCIRKGQYDEVKTLVEALAEDDEIELIVKAKAILLASRFNYMHNLTTNAREIVKKFEEVWKSIDSEKQNENLNLQIAYYTLLVTISKTNEEAKNAADMAMLISPTNLDPLMALGVRYFEQDEEGSALEVFRKVVEKDQKHPYAKYYVHYLCFVLSLKNQQIDQVHGHTYNFDTQLKNDEHPPVFALLLFTKICLLLENSELAYETAKKALITMPNNSYALYLTAMVNAEQLNAKTKEQMDACLNRMEKTMNKVLKLDPNNWEAYRILSKICIDRQAEELCLDYCNKAIQLARRKEDVDVLLKDRLFAGITIERIKKNGGQLGQFNLL